MKTNGKEKGIREGKETIWKEKEKKSIENERHGRKGKETIK